MFAAATETSVNVIVIKALFVEVRSQQSDGSDTDDKFEIPIRSWVSKPAEILDPLPIAGSHHNPFRNCLREVAPLKWKLGICYSAEWDNLQ